jgi:hypothetical protein
MELKIKVMISEWNKGVVVEWKNEISFNKREEEENNMGNREKRD